MRNPSSAAISMRSAVSQSTRAISLFSNRESSIQLYKVGGAPNGRSGAAPAHGTESPGNAFLLRRNGDGRRGACDASGDHNDGLGSERRSRGDKQVDLGHADQGGRDPVEQDRGGDSADGNRGQSEERRGRKKYRCRV